MSSAEILEIREKQPPSKNLNEKLKNTDKLQKSICTIMALLATRSGFHRIYTAKLTGGREHDSELIAQVAFDIPDFRKTRKMESELKKNTSIPVPTILFCDPREHEDIGDSRTYGEHVGAPYMIMEKIPGRTLERMWPNMTQLHREQAIKSLAGYTAQLLQTRFPAIGSLYPGVNVEVPPSLGPRIPTCIPWCFRTDATLDSGPWATEKEYLLGCINRELQWISAHPADLNATWSPIAGSSDLAESYKALFDKLSQWIDAMEYLNSGSGHFVLRHPDFNPSNIMVREDDPSVVTAVLDWESANTAPTWAVAQVPGFLVDRGDESKKIRLNAPPKLIFAIY
ncbi:hypothetical protein FB451DRAFT_1399165 [Mycena latifolia]|nr:hypothetical protein FB451DRAFT_1399165 [Mycena latifolia]